jgi:hypothetical protein
MKFLLIVLTIALFGFICSLEATTSSYLSRLEFPNHHTHTKANDWGGGKTIFLDRHRSNCDIGAISKFHLKRKKSRGRWNRIQYDTVCLMPSHCDGKCKAIIRDLDKRSCNFRNTRPKKLKPWWGFATHYLERHRVKCPVHYVLTNFKLVTKHHRVHYNYRCCPAKVTHCKHYYTRWQKYGNLSTIFLDRQDVKVPNIRTQAMRGFRLRANYKMKTFRYLVWYCTVRG